uniref:DUF2784 family protein n=1 Tax=Accumulibacter sp. TaxID=2053492 RepID=UPI00391CBF55
GFIEHYLLPIIYPAELTRDLQLALAAGVIVVNVGVYGWLLYRRRRSRSEAGQTGNRSRSP